MENRLQMTTIELNGIRIEHDGGDEISIHAEAPSAIKIEDLIGELRTLLPQTSEGIETSLHSSQSLCNQREGLGQIVEPA